MKFTAKKLPQKMAPSGWLAILPPRKETSPLESDMTADIAIIGAGFAGLSAARRLHQIDPKLHVVVLDALAVGEGSAGRNSGFMIDLPHDVGQDTYAGQASDAAKSDIWVNRQSIAFATAAAEENGWGKETFDPCGRHNFSTSDFGDRHLVDYAKQLTGLGEAHKLLTAQESQAITGSAAFTSGLFMPGCPMLQPAGYIRALADSLRSPVTLHERSPVTSFEKTGNGWLIKTAKGSVAAKKVILANNGHANSFGIYEGKILHIVTYGSLTEEFEPSRLSGERKWAATPAHPMGTTMRRLRGAKGDRLIIRSKYTYNPSIEITDGDIASASRIQDKKFAHRFPMLKGLKFEYRWGGMLALTWNAVPFTGEIEPGLYPASVCNGIGLTKATANGIAAAEVVLGQPSGIAEIFAKMAKPKSLPPQILTTIGTKATIAYRRWHAGTE
jgi:glycine/D-amino acid oxidase-like deaminating enzyme